MEVRGAALPTETTPNAPTETSPRPNAIALAADVFCQRWTPLIIREVMLGRRRFSEIRAELGIATNSLAARLRQLVAEGVLERISYSDHPPRAEYHLTDKGRALLPLLAQLQRWGEQHVNGAGGKRFE